MDKLPPGTLTVLSRTPLVLRSLLEGLPAQALATADEGGWTPRHIVAHLVDRQPVQRRRIDRTLEEERPFLPDEPESLEATGAMSRPLAGLVRVFAAAREGDMRVFEALSPTELDRRAVHEVAGELSIAEMVSHIAYHDLVHIRQVAGILAMTADAGRGAMRRFS